MDDHNTRAKAIWDTIKVSTSFQEKQVVDLGCGHGDFVWRAYQEGAIYVLGIDHDSEALQDAIARSEAHGTPITFGHARIEDFLVEKTSNSFTYYDIALCFSVLPYLSIQYDVAVKLISNLSPISFYEIQYIGDGPGKELRDDRDAQELFRQHYDQVDKIGWTQAKPNHTRTIWRCQDGGRYR
jgi:SAM-dependent methyltransferase